MRYRRLSYRYALVLTTGQERPFGDSASGRLDRRAVRPNVLAASGRRLRIG